MRENGRSAGKVFRPIFAARAVPGRNPFFRYGRRVFLFRYGYRVFPLRYGYRVLSAATFSSAGPERRYLSHSPSCSAPIAR